jgi:hypothetical protein
MDKQDPASAEFQTGLSSLRVLENALRVVVQDVLTTLVQQPPRMIERMQITRPHSGQIVWTSEVRSNWSSLMETSTVFDSVMTRMSLGELAGVVHAIPAIERRVLADGEGRPITDEKSAASWLWGYFVMPFMGSYLAHDREPIFDADRFDRLFACLARELGSETARVIRLSPLRNLEMTCAPIEFEPGFRLRPLRDDEMETWAKRVQGGWTPIHVEDVLSMNCAIEEVRHEPVASMRLEPRLGSRADDLVTALRLVTEASVQPMFTEEAPDLLVGCHIRSGAVSGSLVMTPGSVAKLDDDCCDQLREVWRRLREYRSDKRLSLALRRWNASMGRLSGEDQMIDYWIVLEALFLPDGGQELSYRACLRSASFLGKSTAERQSLFKDLRDSYGLRSSTVHGREPEDPAAVPALVVKVRHHVRDAIMKVLEDGVVPNHERLDQFVLGIGPAVPDDPATEALVKSE